MKGTSLSHGPEPGPAARVSQPTIDLQSGAQLRCVLPSELAEVDV
jgi:hypothetical protein